MKQKNDHEFQFKQNDHHQPHPFSNPNLNPPKQRAQTKLEPGQPPQPKILMCADEKFGINLQEHLSKLQHFYEEKLLKESITRAVIGTFQRKKIIGDREFQIQRAFEDAANQSKCYVDKIQTWLGDSIAHSPCLVEFEQYKKKKLTERAAKIDSIMSLIQKIAMKVQQKKLEQIKADFEQSLQEKVVKIPENKEYNKSIYKMKFIKERIAANKKQFQNRIFEDQESRG